MAYTYVICPIIGTGQDGDPYRPKVADLPDVMGWVAVIPNKPDGSPMFDWTLVFVRANSFTSIDADPTILDLFGRARRRNAPHGRDYVLALADVTLGSLPSAARTSARNSLAARGLSAVDEDSLLAIVMRVGQALDSAFFASGNVVE